MTRLIGLAAALVAGCAAGYAARREEEAAPLAPEPPAPVPSTPEPPAPEAPVWPLPPPEAAPPQPPRETVPLPEWTTEVGKRPEVAKECSPNTDFAQQVAMLHISRALLEKYCGLRQTGPNRRESSGRFVGPSSMETWEQKVDGETCVFVRMMWRSIVCLYENGREVTITNPEFNVTP